MARRAIQNRVTLGSWAECDEALRRMGENSRDILAEENVLNERIAAARKLAADRTRALIEENADYAAALERFALAHRGDFGNAKTKALNFGSVSFRQSTRVKLPKDKGKLKIIIDRLRALGMNECIKEADPKIDKDALRKYGSERITEVGGSLCVEETFGYEINEEMIRT